MIIITNSALNLLFTLCFQVLCTFHFQSFRKFMLVYIILWTRIGLMVTPKIFDIEPYSAYFDSIKLLDLVINLLALLIRDGFGMKPYLVWFIFFTWCWVMGKVIPFLVLYYLTKNSIWILKTGIIDVFWKSSWIGIILSHYIPRIWNLSLIEWQISGFIVK